MDITDFKKLEEHPWGVCKDFKYTYEKESVLRYMLNVCMDKGEFGPVKTKYNHPTMVSDGLLEEVGDKEYLLTKKAIGLLYTVCGVY